MHGYAFFVYPWAVYLEACPSRSNQSFGGGARNLAGAKLDNCVFLDIKTYQNDSDLESSQADSQFLGAD